MRPRALDRSRPLCADEAAERGDPLPGTASRVSAWLLVEYGGRWPYEPLDTTVFVGGLRERLAAQLAEVAGSRLFLVKRPGEGRRDRVTVMYGRTPGRFRRLELATHGGLMDLDLAGMLRDGDGPGEPVGHPLLLVCSHGIRDRCCAKYGQELCRSVNALAPDGWAWQTTHVGGDRFAGNLVVLPEGLFFGRVGREEAPRVLRSYLEGRIDLGCYRGRSADPFPVQAAEAAVREQTGLTGLHDLRVTGRHSLGDGVSEIELLAEVSGETHRVRVERRLGEPRLLTCRAREPRPPRSFAATLV